MKIWNKAAAVVLCIVLIAGILGFEPAPMVVSATSSTKDKIDKTKREKQDLEDELDKTQDNLGNLEGKRDSLKKELNYLNDQLSQVVENLEQLEEQIRQKEQEIVDTQAALEEARETEKWQYANMVAIVRCMYERQ